MVTLQEAARGVATGGGADIVTWLSYRLGMGAIFSPGRDWQVGNANLSRLPMTESRYGNIYRVLGETQRSYILGVYEADGRNVTVINTHLSVAVPWQERALQIQDVLAAWGNAPHTLIAGDMNTSPEKLDIPLFFEAGLTSAQDVAGDPTATTYSSTRPLFRIDWIFGTDDLTFVDFEIPQTTASDHLPLVTTVELE